MIVFAARTLQEQREQQARAADAERQLAERECEELCKLLGALSQRDTGRTVVRVFRVVVQRSDPQTGIGSSELAQLERINRLTALHHLNRLHEMGLVQKQGSRYFLRSFDEIFDEMEADAIESIKRARTLARQIETQLGEERQHD